MEELINRTWELRKKCREHGDQVNQLLDQPSDIQDPRSGCFPMIFNTSTMYLELLSYYHDIWGKPHVRSTPEEIEKAKQQNAERCVMLLKSLFVMSMSSIEFSAKASIAYYGNHPLACSLLANRGRFVYLSNIMKKSQTKGLITESAYHDWDGLIAIRNCMVHNNGIPDRDDSYTIGKLSVVATKDKMLQGKLEFFLDLTDSAVDRYSGWIIALINRCST